MTEFENWLRKGLGRAAVFLQKNDGRTYRAPLLYACTHDLTYDRQCEDRRGQYLLGLIAASRDEKFYRDSMLDVLKNGGEDVDFAQVFEIAGDYARKGDAAMKAAMYAAFGARGYVNMGLCAAEELVRLDGLDAFLFVAKSFGEEEAADRPWQFRSLIEVLEERDGQQLLPAELDGFRREAEERSRDEAKPLPETTTEALDQLAADLLLETDPKQLSLRLRRFAWRVFPGPIDGLLELARSEDRSLARAARNALSNLSDPRIRDLGLKLINHGDSSGVRLLAKNAAPGDYKIFNNMLLPGPAEAMHEVEWCLRTYIEENPSTEAERSLLFLYEHGPCALCRSGVVELLITIGRLPSWMSEECHYDTQSETRELVSSLQ